MAAWSYALLALVGFVGSVLNVIGGGGSFLTLPVLIFLGLPAAVANGTNRAGVLAQNITAVWAFQRHRVLDWPWALASCLPAGAGALVGAWLSLRVGERDFRRILAVVMVGLTLWTLVAPEPQSPERRRSPWSPPIVLGFLGVGLYGGFVQAGVGFLVLAVTSFAGLDLVRGNAVKVFAVGVLTLLSLAVFASGSSVDWPAAVALSTGSLAGGVAGVHVTVLKGHGWLRHATMATVVVFAVLLWFS